MDSEDYIKKKTMQATLSASEMKNVSTLAGNVFNYIRIYWKGESKITPPQRTQCFKVVSEKSQDTSFSPEVGKNLHRE